jgi:hypothetical protein
VVSQLGPGERICHVEYRSPVPAWTTGDSGPEIEKARSPVLFLLVDQQEQQPPSDTRKN